MNIDINKQESLWIGTEKGCSQSTSLFTLELSALLQPPSFHICHAVLHSPILFHCQSQPLPPSFTSSAFPPPSTISWLLSWVSEPSQSVQHHDPSCWDACWELPTCLWYSLFSVIPGDDFKTLIEVWPFLKMCVKLCLDAQICTRLWQWVSWILNVKTKTSCLNFFLDECLIECHLSK